MFDCVFNQRLDRENRNGDMQGVGIDIDFDAQLFSEAQLFDGKVSLDDV